MTKPKGTMKLRRSAGGGRGEEWDVTFNGTVHRVRGDEAAALTKLRELARDASRAARPPG